MRDTKSRLLIHWANAGAEPNAGATDEELRNFQQEHHVRLPADLCSYLGEINGMREDWHHDQDANGFCFWSLSRFCRVEVASFREQGIREEAPQFFIFADYLSSCWEYAIGLWSTEKEGNPVLLIND